MSKFLVDENLSPHIAFYLRELGYDAVSVREVELKGMTDLSIIQWIKRQNESSLLATLILESSFIGSRWEDSV